MNLQKKLMTAVFCMVCCLLLFPTVRSVDAADISVATVDQMKPYIESAMQELQTSYTITYTGNSTISSTQWNTVFSDILNKEGNDYIANILKSRKVLQTGTAGNISVTFTFTYWETAEQAAAVDAKVTDVISDLGVSGMNDYEKEKVIHDWIVSNVIYDTTYTNHSAYSAITTPYKTVCQGYALLAYKMFTEAGLTSRIITGTGNGQSHAWNLVLVDGKWYQIDLTWDDPISSSPDTIHYDYYNLTDSEMGVDHKWSGNWPAATTEFSTVLTDKISSDASNASVYQGLIDALGIKYLTDSNTCSSAVDIQYRLQSALAKNETKIDFRYMSKTLIPTDLKTAATALGYITSYQYTLVPYARTTYANDVIVNVSFTSSIPVKTTGVTLSKDTMSLVLGGAQTTLIATVAPANASTKTVVWSTSNAAVATVKNGVVKAIGGGTATITATTVDGSFSDSCDVTVTAAVKSVKLDQVRLSLTVGASDATLTPSFTPISATLKDVTWTSSNPNIASVTGGAVHAVAPGKAVITVITGDGAKKATCNVTVYSPSTSVTLASELTVLLGKSTLVTATVVPSTAYKGVSWSSGDEAIVKISAAGVITPVAEGTTTITATTSDGNTANCTVTVIRGVTGITLDKTTLILQTDDSDVKLTATVAPTTATIKSVSFVSNNPAVATVDLDGNVSAVAPGKATITAASTQDVTKTAKCTVTVYNPVDEIKLSASELTLKLGRNFAMVPTITPSTAYKGVTWTSNKESVAKVSAAGVITPVAPGEAIITVTTADTKHTASCVVTVVRGVTGITLDKTALTMLTEDPKQKITVTVAPADATFKTVTFTSSNTNIVTVDPDGYVYAKAPGKATITVASTQDSTRLAKCLVTIYSPVSDVKLPSDSLILYMDKTTMLSATVTPSTAIRDVTWSSDNESVVKVSPTGLLTPVSVGSANITVTASDNSSTDICSVTVKRGVTGVTLDKTMLTMLIGDLDVKLTETIAPADASTKSVTFKSSNTNVVTVDPDGYVHAVAPGKATITVSSTQDATKTARCSVTVYSPVTGITISTTKYVLKLGKLLTLSATVAPLTALKDITWTSNDESVAKVNASGTVTPIAAGEATITASAADGESKAYCVVDVIQPVTGIKLDQSSIALQVGGSVQKLTATISPVNATTTDVTWTSSNQNVVTVGSDGTLHAVAPGTAYITVTSVQDTTKYVKCIVTVTAS